MMTKQDYLDWAEDYRRQADILAEKIDRLRERLKNPHIRNIDRSASEAQLIDMIDMKLECRCAMMALLKRAEGIKE